MMKKRLLSVLLSFVFVFVFSMPVLAVNDIDIDQVSPDNYAYSGQSGENLDIDVLQDAALQNDITVTQDGTWHIVNITQTATTGYNDATTINQVGDIMNLTAEQTAETNNDLTVGQDGFDSGIIINQTAANGYNAADVTQNADNALITVGAGAGQNATENNILIVSQTGEFAILTINQIAANGSNYADIGQGTAVSIIDVDQFAGTDNEATITTYVGNNALIDIFQTASEYNHADVSQNGTSSNSVIAVNQSAGTNNDLDIVQNISSTGICSLRLSQTALDGLLGYNDADITLTDPPGSDPSLLTNADAAGVPGDDTQTATQLSANGSNTLLWVAEGGDNTLGVFQAGLYDNYVEVNQTGGINSLGVYQTAVDGSNTLTATQSGNCTYAVHQVALSGNNEATVTQ